MDWWKDFFDEDYLRIWEGSEGPDETERQVEGLWQLLGLKEGARVLDAPCGYGRISSALARRGVQVVGVDLSGALLAEAERRRGQLPVERLRYHRHDLRTPMAESPFDVALNIFSSLGYGTESEDLAILTTLRSAVAPGGVVFVETMHRDRLIEILSQSPKRGSRLPDGTLLVEEVRLDPVTGRAETTWHWSGPAGSGHKSASTRVYAATELVRLMEAAGLEVRSVHNGCSPEPFVTPGTTIGRNRLGILAVRR